MIEFTALRKQWIHERPKYDALCARIKSMIQDELRRRGIECTVTSRTKEPDSLLKKAVLKGYTNPLSEITDKAGVRVVCTYQDSIEIVEEIINSLFHVCKYENKTSAMSFNQFGYSGIHFDVCLLPGNSAGCDQRLDQLPCEIQVMTRAQNLWADVSHDLTYKPTQEPPIEVKRLIYLQSALVEIFDKQVQDARITIMSTPGFQENKMLDLLKSHYMRFDNAEYNRELSLEIIAHLKEMYTDRDEMFHADINDFVSRNESMICQVFENNKDECYTTPLLFQPESLFVFMCIEKDPETLKDIWAKFLPLEYLQRLADIWGVDIGPIE